MDKNSTKNSEISDSTEPEVTSVEENRAADANTTEKMTKKRKILNPEEYKEIYDFIMNYNGLVIECEMEMIFLRYPDIERQTLKSILQTELGKRTRSLHWRLDAIGKKHLKSFQEKSADSWDTKILVSIAVKEKIPPVALCRAILQEKYQFTNKTHITRLLKYPSLINDAKLSANVMQCICCDSQEGPLIDLRRRVLGEEYEFMLKEMATAASMHFYDENDLRRLGYDKTPDIKLILPFLYKDKVVNWIESKACFGDPKTHKFNIQQQLNSYINRFGPGIVIYWFGYRTDTPEITENGAGIIVLDDFPSPEHMEFLQLNDDKLDDTSISEICDNMSKQQLKASDTADFQPELLDVSEKK